MNLQSCRNQLSNLFNCCNRNAATERKEKQILRSRAMCARTLETSLGQKMIRKYQYPKSGFAASLSAAKKVHFQAKTESLATSNHAHTSLNMQCVRISALTDFRIVPNHCYYCRCIAIAISFCRLRPLRQKYICLSSVSVAVLGCITRMRRTSSSRA